MPQQYVLSDDEFDRLMTPIIGNGGMQTYLRSLQTSTVGRLLNVSGRDFDKTCKYLGKMGDDGGWQRQIPERLRDDALEVITRP